MKISDETFTKSNGQSQLSETFIATMKGGDHAALFTSSTGIYHIWLHLDSFMGQLLVFYCSSILLLASALAVNIINSIDNSVCIIALILTIIRVLIMYNIQVLDHCQRHWPKITQQSLNTALFSNIYSQWLHFGKKGLKARMWWLHSRRWKSVKAQRAAAEDCDYCPSVCLSNFFSISISISIVFVNAFVIAFVIVIVSKNVMAP